MRPTKRDLVQPNWMSDEDWQATLGKVESLERIRRDAQAHLAVYASSGGKEGFIREGAPAPCLLLTTIGRKSGKQRTTPVNFMQDGNSYIVVGSLAGYERDPGWALNLRNKPRAWIQVRDNKVEATVRLVSGEERKRLWPRLVEWMPLWAVFQDRTDREFPVFVLTPKA